MVLWLIRDFTIRIRIRTRKYPIFGSVRIWIANNKLHAEYVDYYLLSFFYSSSWNLSWFVFFSFWRKNLSWFYNKHLKSTDTNNFVERNGQSPPWPEKFYSVHCKHHLYSKLAAITETKINRDRRRFYFVAMEWNLTYQVYKKKNLTYSKSTMSHIL